MARPRVFISSTFYDLRQIRADLDRFISDQGFDAVANERGDISYGSEESLEEYCYKEIDNCDIVVAIIGGRFGTESSQDKKSISQIEIRTAVQLGRQLYIFIDSDVYGELKTYKLNKDNDKIAYAHADDPRIFEFIEEMERQKSNNVIFPFREGSDIIRLLREQWAGLFQRLLRATSRQQEVKMIDSLKATSQSLEELVKYIAEKAERGDAIVHDILLPNHPIFAVLAENLSVKYRVFFQNLEEMKTWLSALGYKYRDGTHELYTFDRYRSFNKRSGSVMNSYVQHFELHVSTKLFDTNGALKFSSLKDWDPDNILFEAKPAELQVDDEIPF